MTGQDGGEFLLDCSKSINLVQRSQGYILVVLGRNPSRRNRLILEDDLELHPPTKQEGSANRA